MNFLSPSTAACPTDTQSPGAIILSRTQLAGSQCEVDDRNNAQQRNPLSERWAGVSLAANLGIQSGPHLSAEGGFCRPACWRQQQPNFNWRWNSNSISSGLWDWEKAGQLLLLLLLLLLSSCFLPATSHRAPALLTRCWRTHPLPSTLTHTEALPASSLTHPWWVSLPLAKNRSYSLPSPTSFLPLLPGSFILPAYPPLLCLG